MDNKRFLLALALSLAIIFAFQRLSPVKPPVRPVGQDTTATTAAPSPSNPASSATPATGVAATNAANAANTVNATGDTTSSPVPAIAPEQTTISARTDSGATFTLTNLGASPTSATMHAYQNRAYQIGRVNVGDSANPLIKYHLVINKQAPIDLSTVPFSTVHNGDTVTYHGVITGTTVAIRYVGQRDGHTLQVSGSVTGPAGQQSYLLVSLPQTFTPTEPDTAADQRAFSYAYLSKRDGARSVAFSSLDPGEQKFVEGPIDWMAAKTKYFVVAVIQPDSAHHFAEATLQGGPRVAKVATHASATVTVPVQNSTFAFTLYAGPQEWRRLHAIGSNFEEVNPYGWAFLRGILHPIATGAIRLVLWMHQRLHLSYGLVLILLGVLVRVILWPLNHKAMRTTLKMQALQPELQEIQRRYKSDPEKQRIAMFEVYKKHNMSPFSSITGCLPMFLPMPVLFALFFVFQNTIEFRGAQFLWLTDLSSHDPYYILPVIMAVSMYLLSWLGMRNMPPNPQSKMMSYLMPVIFLFFMWRLASGLNLYYAVQNFAALPQQWLLTRERAKQAALQGQSGSLTAPVQGTETKQSTKQGTKTASTKQRNRTG